MKKLIFLSFLFCVSFRLLAETTVIFVTPSGSNDTTVTGLSWGNAVGLNRARDLAVNKYPDHQLWLKGGTYNLTTAFNISKNLNIYGGFSGSENNLSERSWATNKTIFHQTTTNAVVLFSTGDAEVILDGLVFENGNKTNSSSVGGLGVAYSGVTFRNCIIRNNSNTTATGNNSTLLIGVSGKTSTQTGKVTIDNCLIINNECISGPAAILVNSYYTLEIINTTIANNYAQSGSSPVIGFNGGTGSVVDVYNSVLHNNLNGASPALSIGTAGLKTLHNNAWEIEPSNGTKSGNIMLTNFPFEKASTYVGIANESDKLFSVIENSNFSLATGSPCIDAGNVAYMNANTTVDISGASRIVNDKIDMGCYEYIFPTGFELLKSENLRVAGNKLYIPQSKNGCIIRMYNFQGQLIKEFKTTSSTIELSEKGLYILKAVELTLKTILL